MEVQPQWGYNLNGDKECKKAMRKWLQEKEKNAEKIEDAVSED